MAITTSFLQHLQTTGLDFGSEHRSLYIWSSFAWVMFMVGVVIAATALRL